LRWRLLTLAVVASLLSQRCLAATNFTAPSVLTAVALADGSSIAVDASVDKCIAYTLTIAGAAHTISNPTGLRPGQCLNFFITEGGSGGFLPSWDTEYIFPYGPASINAAAAAVSVVSCESVSTTVIYCIGPPLATVVNNFFNTTATSAGIPSSNTLRAQNAGMLSVLNNSFRLQLLKSLH
jgi:hypothetical protein